MLRLLKEKNIKLIVKNFFSLTILQALNILLPFLVMPFLIQTVGIEKFGLLTFVHTVILSLQVFTEYGFNTIATREVSVEADNPKRVSEIFSEVIQTKILLMLASFVVLFILVFTIDKLTQNYLLYFLYFGIIIGQSIFPVWLFQGLQAMKYITYVNVVFKSIFTICIFIFVKDKTDIWLVPLFMSLGFIFAGIASLVIANKKFAVNYTKVPFASVKRQLKTAYYMFLSEIQMIAMSYLNVLVLGFLIGDAVVGVYSSAEKVIRAIGSMQTPIINAVFPYVSKLMIEDKSKAIQLINKIKNVGVIVFTLFILALFVFATPLFKVIYGGETVPNAILIFRILLVFPLFSFLDQVYGRLVLLTANQEKQFFKVFFVAAITSVLLVFGLTYLYGSIGTAVANSVVQFFILLGMYYFAKPIISSKIKNDK